ncbi:MAG: NAD(+) synthase [Faecalibacterium sp.]|nr:NAD(+) synthase [Ruminococcus sp.]MCM1392462.1 NAD(+) synthase [Ruminococcus sp.]MCM1486165.1 NAD(+) synthase [Faecalibacterium sp.]
MFDFLTIALAVIKTQVGNTEHNTEQITDKISRSKDSKADIIAFPELAITGYTCGDLFNQKTLLDGTIEGLKKILAKSTEVKKIIIVGAPLRINGQLYNCAVVIFDGSVIGIIPKTFIPTTGEFYEKRWFCSASDLSITEITEKRLGLSGCEKNICIGTDLVFSAANSMTFAIEVCEDLWTPLPPSTFSALAGAKLLINISASNETIGKRQYRRELVSQQSARNLAAYAYVSSGKSESTTDLVFSGHSLVCENGIKIAENENYLDDDYILYADIDLGKIDYDRMKNKSFKDTATLYGKAHPCRYVEIDGDCFGKSTAENTEVNRLPFVPSTQKDRFDRCIAIFEMQVAGLCKRLEVTNCKPVIGVSGGLDSTLALLVCTQAMRKLGRPLTDVIGITMPCFGTSDRTYNNSIELMKTLGITSKEINIKKACLQHFEDIGQSEDEYNLTYENSQARERTQVLMDYAGKIGGLVVGTGDLSELALGWCTYNADHMSMYGVNASIPKTLVRWMVDSIIEFDIFPASSDVLKDVLDTPISPELLPPDADGKIQQQTEELVGPYALHDFFLYYVLRFGFEPEKIYFLAKKAFKGSFDDATILKWLKSFYRRFFSQQFKRSCLPDGVKVGSVCLSPRGDWRMPSDASAAIWLKRVEEIADNA